jgi:transcriptional regulator with XRE-family HTH domain
MPQKIIPRFREARVAAQLSLRRAAELIGRTASAVQKWENGTNSPTVGGLPDGRCVWGERV